MVLLLAQDHHNRLAAVQRQSLSLATSADDLLQMELTNLGRSLRGQGVSAQTFLTDAPARAPGLIEASLRGLLMRHPELRAVAVLDAQGQRRFGGAGDPQLPTWTTRVHCGGSQVCVGPAQRLADSEIVLPIAVSSAGGNWIVGQLRAAALQHIVRDVDIGADGVVALIDAQGVPLVVSGPGVDMQQWLRSALLGRLPQRVALGMRTDVFDAEPRMLAISGGQAYPLRAVAGLGVRETLVRWWWFVATAASAYVLYLLGFAYLLGSLRRAERRQRQLLQRLSRGDEELRLACDMGGIGTWRIDTQRRLMSLSEPTVAMLGLQRMQLSLDEFLAQVHDEDRMRVAQLYEDAVHSHGEYNAAYRIHMPDGRVRWLAARGALVQTQEGLCMTGAVQDVTERLAVQARLFDAERQFRLMFDRNPLPYWVFAVGSLRFLEVNQAAIGHYGYSRDEFLEMSLLDLHPREDALRLLCDVRTARAGFSAPDVWTHRRKDGSVLSVCVHSSDLEFAGMPARLILAEEVTQRLAHERELAFRASHDVATGLFNPHALAEALRVHACQAYAIAYVQLRGLALIGDTLGRTTGDAVRCVVAERLRGLGERFGLTAHQPSQDFVLAVLDPQALEQALQALLEAMSAPVQGSDFSLQLQAHIGVALCPHDAVDAEEAIGCAAQAAHAAQADGCSMLRFDRSMSARIGERLRLAGRLHEAIEREEFVLYFQPIMDTDSGAPRVLEALIRWPQADGGFIPPDQFIQGFRAGGTGPAGAGAGVAGAVGGNVGAGTG
ncbi:PAS domain S-box protein [Xanthomonas sp. MUS 060]|uniref:PAS domain S-box protein n=1 Tax=Xanthomonas sp. MUS 060 TaxID=1588031 RepID=UPI001F190843|nr:PAS domain S-box protein [Xanthomonas sp. MUS 060]